MSIFRKILIAALTASMAVCAGIAVAGCTNDEPVIVNPPSETTEGDYTITVKSQGGMLLGDVKVWLEKDGEKVGEEYLTGANGKVAVKITPDVYDIKIERTGYFIPAGSVNKTSADEKEYTVIAGSKVIESPAPAGTKYKLGDVMYDFSFTDVDGVTYSLSETLKTKNTVVINFWGTQCQPCRSEMPAMQQAYEDYEIKLELFALSSYRPYTGAPYDTEEEIRAFKDQGSYTYPMALDSQTGIYRLFDVSGYPTTYIIDRYGVVALRTVGSNTNASEWKNQFKKFTDENYSQIIDAPINPGDIYDVEWCTPDAGLEMPSSSAIAEAVAGTIAQDDVSFYYDFNTETNPDAATNWPWMIGEKDGNKYLYASNVKANKARSIFYANVTLNAGEGLKFDYYTDTHSTNNMLMIVVNGTILNINGFYGDSGGWVTYRLPAANHRTTYNLSFVYMKYAEILEDTLVGIDNFMIYDPAEEGETLDLAYSITDDATLTAGKYDVNIYTGDDGLYHCTFDYKGKTKDSILYADIYGVTSWTEKHYGSTIFSFESEEEFDENGDPKVSYYLASLYYLSFYKMSTGNGPSQTLNFGHTDTWFKCYYLQAATVHGNGYVPVTDEVKDLLCAFIAYAYETELVEDDYYDDQWLEFCYYFMHWGDEHVYVEDNLTINGEEVAYDEEKDVYTVASTIDETVYISFVDASFEIIVNGYLKNYSLNTCIDMGMFNDVNGKNYTADIKAYQKLTNTTGLTRGMVKADKKLAGILTEFVNAYLNLSTDDGWTTFAYFLNEGACSAENNPYAGLTFDYPLEAVEGTNEIVINEIMNITPIYQEAGGGIKYKFVPDKDGVYSFASSTRDTDTNPCIYVYDSDFRMIAHQEADVRYNHFDNGNNPNDFYLLIELEAGKTYYFAATLASTLMDSIYTMDITYEGTYAEMLRVAATGNGMWAFRPMEDEDGNVMYDENGDIIYDYSDTYFIAVDVAYDRTEEVYKQMNSNGSYGSTMYIDFIHTTFFSFMDDDGKAYYYPTLYELMTTFNKNHERFDAATVEELNAYYERAMGNEGELHGLVEADLRLVEIIDEFMTKKAYAGERDSDPHSWEMFACYYETFGTPDAQ